MIAKPLTELTKNVPFRWSEESQCLLDALKKCFTSGPILLAFNPGRNTFVTTDALKFTLGAVLEQDLTDGRHPIAFLSKILSSAE